jgi:hypothetical protein
MVGPRGAPSIVRDPAYIGACVGRRIGASIGARIGCTAGIDRKKARFHVENS